MIHTQKHHSLLVTKIYNFQGKEIEESFLYLIILSSEVKIDKTSNFIN